jgi:hypothetical protein
MYTALESNKIAGGQQAIFSIGHVLRYSPHNMLLRKLVLQDRVIGDILSVVHTEPVGWWHFAHSYVRGNWYVWRERLTSALQTWLCPEKCPCVVLLTVLPGAARVPPPLACSPKVAMTSTSCFGCCARPRTVRPRIAPRRICPPPSPAPARSSISSEAASQPRQVLPPTASHAPPRASASTRRSASMWGQSWQASSRATRGGL